MRLEVIDQATGDHSRERARIALQVLRDSRENVADRKVLGYRSEGNTEGSKLNSQSDIHAYRYENRRRRPVEESTTAFKRDYFLIFS